MRARNGEGNRDGASKEILPKAMKTNQWDRKDLVVSVKGMGRVKWYHLCWFYLSGQERYNTWRGFCQRQGLEVDHGSASIDTLVVDIYRLSLKPKHGRDGRGNASQGGPIRKMRRAVQ